MPSDKGGRLRQPSTLEEELTFYKGHVIIPQLIAERAKLEGDLAKKNDEILEWATALKEFLGWPKLAALLGLGETAARRLLGGYEGE